MRTWILFGALVIAYAINPAKELPPSLNGLIIVLMVAGAIFDLIEFVRNRK